MSAELSKLLETKKNIILNRWEEEIKAILPAARQETKLGLRDSIPVFLDEVVVGLKKGLGEVKPEIIKFAHKHGAERANLSEYSIEDALTEYNVLRKVIFSELESETSITPKDRDFVLEAIDFGMRKAGSEYSKQSQMELNILFELAGTGKTVIDPITGKYLKINDSFSEMLGYSEEEILAQDIYYFTYPEDHTLQKEKLIESTKTNEQITYLKRMIRKNGDVIWVEIYCSPLPGIPGYPHRNIHTIIDVTNKKLIEEQRERIQDKLKKITDIQPSLIGHVDKDLRYLFANKTYEEWFNVSVNDIEGKHVRDLVGEEAFKNLEPYFKRALKGEKVKFESKLRYKNGNTIYTISTYSPDYDPNGNVTGVYVSVTDHTEQRQQLEELKTSEAIRDRFISALSHDLRTPLTSAMLSAQLIMRKTKDISITPLANKIEQGLRRVDKMIEDLLDANRLRAGQKINLKIKETDLSELVKTTIHDLETIYGDRFIVDIPEKFPTWISPPNFRRIIENLCSNAVKYGSQSAPVSIYIHPLGNDFELGVKNYGNPLNQEDSNRLFEQFFRSKKDETSDKKGWGIGLSIVKGVTEAHGGKVTVDSDESGTTFKVILPVDARPFAQDTMHFH